MKLKDSMLLPAVLLALMSCERVSGTGSLRINVVAKAQIEDRVKSNVADLTPLPKASEFTVRITDFFGDQVWSGLLGDWDETTPLVAGEYDISAEYGDVTIEGRDRPCFLGGASFEVKGDETVSVSIPASLQNCVVRVVTTESFDNYFIERSILITTGSGNAFTLEGPDSGDVFMDAYRFSLSGSLKGQDGREHSFGPIEYDGLRQAVCYTVRLDASSVGGLHLEIAFDDSLETVDLGEIEINGKTTL